MNPARNAHRVRDVTATLSHLVESTTYRRKWVYVFTGPNLRLRCAVRRAEEGYELAASREDRPPCKDDVMALRRGLKELRLRELGETVEIVPRNGNDARSASMSTGQDPT